MQTTNIGGRGMNVGLGEELKKLEQISDEYIVATYFIDSYQTIIKSPIEKLIGTRGVNFRNVMQLLYAAYAMQ